MAQQQMKVCVTGAAGFIGFHVAKRLAQLGHRVVGIDNFNPYYDPLLKRARAKALKDIPIIEADIADESIIFPLFEKHAFTHVAHMAAQAGVRHSLSHPKSYLRPNIDGFVTLLEACRAKKTPFIYASSSSVYGCNKKIPFSEKDPVEQPANLYGATKRANELLAYSYHHLYQIPVTGLRFFTVFGPWGRPDMAYFSFTKALFKGTKIPLFNKGQMQRDFTYIDDITEGVISSLEKSHSLEIFNLGNHQPEELLSLVRYLEELTGKKALLDYLPMQPGDIATTYADIEHAKKGLGFSPKTPLREGLVNFVEWYRSYYGV